MEISKELARETPMCACRGYVKAGDTLRKVRGSVGNNVRVWWVACPDCGSALGEPHPSRNFPLSKIGVARALRQRDAEITQVKSERLQLAQMLKEILAGGYALARTDNTTCLSPSQSLERIRNLLIELGELVDS